MRIECPSIVRGLAIALLVASIGVACARDQSATPGSVDSTRVRSATVTTTMPVDKPTTAPAIASPSTQPTTTTTTTTATTTPSFEPGPCVPIPSDVARVTCGFVEVPERHAEPSGPILRMAVAVVAPLGAATSGVPVVFLAGGPGFGSVDAVELFLAESFGARTVVLVDYRGVGLSVPSLACPEVDEFEVSSQHMADADPISLERFTAAVTACHDRLVADGIDLAAYNYTEIAADLADLRIALGYDEWDLYGLSNGGRLALEIVRRHPAGIRSLILDSALPPQGNIPGELWPHAHRAFELLFNSCEADAACATAYPDLRTTFFGLISDLARAPVDIDAPAPDGAGTVPVKLTDTAALNSLRNAMYDTALIPLLPFFISELAAGRGYAEVGQLIVEHATARRFSQGMAFSVSCQEEIAFLPGGFFEDQAAQFPTLAPVILANRAIDACRIWGLGRADPSIDEPVHSDIPALVLVGQYDPVSPPTSSEQVAAGLSRSTLIEFPGLGHRTVTAHPCPASLIAPFLDDPTAPVDTSCVDEMPAPAWLLY